jgi:hypothetical protein
MIIITHSRKELVRRQKACLDYVNKGINNGKDPKEEGLQEAVTDFQRWSKDSKVFNNTDNSSKWVTTFERKEKAKQAQAS